MTGFVWPIKEATVSEDSKKRGTEGESTDTQPSEGALTETSRKSSTSLAATKRKQNNMPLVNAMRTTAVHAHQSFTLPTGPSESTVPNTPGSASVERSSATPAPAVSQRGGTPKTATGPAVPSDTASVKGLPGAGKKKRKRE